MLTKILPKHVRFVFKDSRLTTSAFIQNNENFDYFHLKPMTPLGLYSNVVYCYACSCDTDLTYLGMSSRHLVSRAKEHLDLNQSRKSAIKEHILDSVKCCNSSHSLASFTILQNCKNEYDTKVHEALLTKKFKPKLNCQLYANGCLFLLKVF